MTMPAFNGIVLAIGGSLAVSVIAKVTVTTALGLVAVWLARGNRAAVRHALLAATFGAALLLPITAILMPPVHLGVPVRMQSRATILPTVIGADTNRFVTSGAPGVREAYAAPHGSQLSLADLLVVVWCAGIALFLVPVIVGLWQIRSLRRSGLPWRHGQSIAEPLALRAGIHRRVELLLHEELPAPMTCGFMHPAIILPLDAEDWKREDLDRALIHELEHVRRADSVSRCLARVVCAVYWFHPLVWIAWRPFVLEAERSCDDAVLGHSEATAYADQLVDLARRLSGVRRFPALAMADRLDLGARVKAVLDSRQKRGRAGACAVMLVCAAVFLLVVAVSPVRLLAAPQASSDKLQFEVASIRPITQNADNGTTVTAGLRIDGAQFRVALTLRGIAALAWNAKAYRFEAPEWMSTQWYEIAATLPEGHNKPGEALEMLRTLLADRFHMKTHQETKEMPVYALMLTKSGITAKEDPLDPVGSSVQAVGTSSETTTVSRLQRGATVSAGDDKIELKKFTMAMLADQLTGDMDRPVVDQTGVGADTTYDFTLELTHEDFLATRVRAALAGGMTPPPQAMKLLEASGDSLQIALAKVGLKLEEKKAPMEVLAIDSSDKTPSEN